VETVEDENGALEKIDFKNTDTFNFGFDIVDEIAKKYPDKLAMLHLDKNKVERRFTFNDIKRASNQVANYFKSMGMELPHRFIVEEVVQMNVINNYFTDDTALALSIEKDYGVNVRAGGDASADEDDSSDEIEADGDTSEQD
jgi:hypothetical protein